MMHCAGEDLKTIVSRSQFTHILDPQQRDNHCPATQGIGQILRCHLSRLVVVKDEPDALELFQGLPS